MTADALAAIPAKWASPDPATLAKLPKPTKRDAEKGKCAECGGWHGLPAIHLDYMGHAEVTLALIDADPAWTWEPLALHDGLPAITREGSRLVMWARLTVLGKSIVGVGTCEANKPDPEKELIGDFLRNAAMRFGIGTKLWSKATVADPAGGAQGGGYERHARHPQRRDQPDGDRLTDAQLRRIKATFREIGVTDRVAMLGMCADAIGHTITSSTDLTKQEAAKVIDHLEQYRPADASDLVES